MFKTDSFLGNKKSSSNQNVWRDHATMQQDVLLHFWVIFLYWNQTEIWKKYSVVQLYSFFIVYHYGKQCCLSALDFFHCLPPLFVCLPLWTTVRLHGKKLQNATKPIGEAAGTSWTFYCVICDAERLFCVVRIRTNPSRPHSTAYKQ